MKRILVTTDFSGNSRAGIRFAIRLAATNKASLIFCHMIEVMRPTSWTEKEYKAFASLKTAESEARLRKFVAQVYLKDGLKPGSHTFIVGMGGGSLHGMIIEQARKNAADYICLSTRGAGKLRKLFGTVATGMITHSATPLLIVPHGYRVKPVTTVFYASDFSSPGPELRRVLKFAAPLEARVTVYHYDYLLHVDVVRKKLESAAKRLAGPGVTFTFKRQEIENSLSDHMKEDIKKEKASVVVLFTKQNRNWFDKLFARNESMDMAFNAEVPLLIFRKDQR